MLRIQAVRPRIGQHLQDGRNQGLLEGVVQLAVRLVVHHDHDGMVRPQDAGDEGIDVAVWRQLPAPTRLNVYIQAAASAVSS